MTLNNIFKYRPSNNIRIFSYFIIFYSLLFLVGIHGFGAYWDWTFPYTRNGLLNMYNYLASSWILQEGGAPLKYSPDLYLRLLFSGTYYLHIQTEYIMYEFLVLVFSIGSYGVWLNIKDRCQGLLGFLLPVVVFVNPLMFYKLLAGHINYYPSLVILIFMIFFLKTKKIDSLKRALILGLFLSFVGFQIQFFFLAALYLVFWMIFHKSDFRIMYVLLSGIPVLLINSPWLVNFMVGATDPNDVSENAKLISNISSGVSNIASELNFTFSDATHIGIIYPLYILSLMSLFWLFVFSPFVLKRKKNTNELMYAALILTVLFLATGIYQSVTAGPIAFVSPMFREIGHFGPIAILYCVLLIGNSPFQKQWYKYTLTSFIAIFIAINAVIYVSFLPTVNYDKVRNEFAKYPLDASSKYNERTLTYPFFGQYSYIDTTPKSSDNFLLSNVGYDNFMKFSGVNYLENAIRSIYLKNSPQYKLVNSYDLEVLKPYNIKYILDFSKIYESNYNLYVSKSVYNSNVNIIKSDPDFFNKLLEHNPGKIKQLEAGVYEITDSERLISSPNKLVTSITPDNDGVLKGFVENVYGNKTSYTSDTGYLGETISVKSLFGSAPQTSEPKEKSDFKNTNDSYKPQSGFSNNRIHYDTSNRLLSYTVKDQQLTLYASEPNDLKVNELPLNTTNTEYKVLKQYPIKQSNRYVIKYGASYINELIPDGYRHDLGVIQPETAINIYTIDGTNIISNPSFDKGTWQPKVNDCNNYDKNPQISMEVLSSSLTSNYLSLSAVRHAACSYTNIPAAQNSTYLISFKYQSKTSQSVDYSIQYDSSKYSTTKIPVNDDDWHTYTNYFETSKFKSAKFYVYAREQSNGQINTVNYDDLNIIRLLPFQSFQTDFVSANYASKVLKDNDAFEFKLDNISSNNLIPSDNFDRGLWDTKVNDCDKYDSNPDISMTLRRGEGFKGSNMLNLRARKHIACTFTTVSVVGGQQYNLDFNYKSDQLNGSMYSIEFNDQFKTIESYTIGNTGTSWQSLSSSFVTPKGATNAIIQFYAKETNGIATTNLSLSDIFMSPSTKLSGRYFITSNRTEDTSSSHSASIKIDAKRSNNSGRKFNINNASGYQTIVLGEAYNDKWDLRDSQGKILDAKHIKIDGYSNGWVVDINKICSGNSMCSKSNDGSYSMAMSAYFAPQKYFDMAIIVSRSTIIICLANILYRHRNTILYKYKVK